MTNNNTNQKPAVANANTAKEKNQKPKTIGRLNENVKRTTAPNLNGGQTAAGKPAQTGNQSKNIKPAALSQKAAQAAPGALNNTAQGKPAISDSPAKRNETRKPNQNRAKKPQKSNKPLRITPLGGLDEIGKNITMYEYDGDMILVDCGMAFPDEDMPGVDIVIPDFSHVVKNKDKIKGLVVTHGHEDHIGGIPYLLKAFNVPIYATRLTLGLISGKLKEHKLLNSAKLHTVAPKDVIQLGKFTVEFIHVNHSIPDAVAVAIRCPAGLVVQTGDFKIDTTPIDNEMIDIARFSELGKEGVLALLSDSTNVERGGFTASERTVGDSFGMLFKRAGDNHQRIIVASFSSNIHRVQQIIDEAVRCGRKVAVSGRSMINVVGIAGELGYLKIPAGVLIDIDMISRYTPEQIVIITTGSQGEPMSALYRMAYGDHRQVAIIPGDMIIISATPIPGNEKTVSKVVNELMKLEADVIYEKMYDVHVSGHACQEELKLILNIVNPKYFIPVHGEHRMLVKHASLAHLVGIPKENTLITGIGHVVEITENSMKEVDTVPAGRVLVDGYGVGDVGSVVLRDRKHLAEDGIFVVVISMDSATGEVVSGPDLVSRGFVYVRESEQLLDDTKEIACKALENCYVAGIRDWSTIKIKVRDAISKFLYEKTKRSPMILPIIMDI